MQVVQDVVWMIIWSRKVGPSTVPNNLQRGDTWLGNAKTVVLLSLSVLQSCCKMQGAVV